MDYPRLNSGVVKRSRGHAATTGQLAATGGAVEKTGQTHLDAIYDGPNIL